MPFFRESPALLASFRSGDRTTLTAVYCTYSPSVERQLKVFARRLPKLGCSLGIDDLHQDTFERAFSLPARLAYDATRQFGPYLMTIAHNCFVDAVRRGRRELLNAELSALENVDALPREEPLRDPHVAQLLEVYVRKLQGPLRSTFEQRFVLGRSQAVASGELGVTRRTLRTCEEHLKRGLKRALQAEGMFRGDW